MNEKKAILSPAEVLLPCPNLKMAFGDAKVEGRIADERELRLGFHTVALMQHELELLLVDGSRCQQSGFHSPAEPFGHGTFDTAKMLDALLLRMGIALVGTITQCDHGQE